MFRRGRFFFWLISELVHKYTRALALGLVIGVALGLFFSRYPLSSLWQFGSVVRIGIVGEFTPTTLPLAIQKLISFGLTDLSPDGSPAPAAATSWEATDEGKTFTFHLRGDLVWHDGKGVVAKDVNYNIRNVTFTAVAPTTLRVSTNASYSPFPTLVSKPILRPGLIGFGPYRVASIRLNADTVTYLRLVPVSGTKLPAREYRFYRTEALAFLAYKMGDVDMLTDVTTIDPLKHWGKPTVTEKVMHNRIVTLFFNMRDARFKEKTIRQALAYGMPAWKAERASSPITKTSWAYTDNVRVYDPDPARAAKLLADTPLASSSAVTITTFAPYVDIAQSIANSWSSLGVNANVKVESSVPANYQVLLSVIDIPPDPDQYAFWHSTQAATNITGYTNVKIDKLLEDGRQELDPEKRQKIYTDFQKRLVDDAPAIFLYYPAVFTVSRYGR